MVEKCPRIKSIQIYSKVFNNHRLSEELMEDFYLKKGIYVDFRFCKENQDRMEKYLKHQSPDERMKYQKIKDELDQFENNCGIIDTHYNQ